MEMDLMTKKLINVQISSIDQLVTIICEIDENQAGELSRDVIRKLVEKAHDTIIEMMGDDAKLLYAAEES